MSREEALRPITRGPGDFAGFITDDDMVAVINQVYDDIPVSKDKPEYDNLVLKTGTTGMTGVFGWEQSAELNIGAATISEDGTGLRISPLSGDQDLFFDLNKKRWVFSAGPLGESPVEIHGPITQYVTPALDEHVTNKGYVDNEVSRKYEDGRAYTDERVSDTRLEINNKLDPLILRVDVIQDLVLSPDTPSLKVVEAEVKDLGSRVLVLENAPPSSGGGTVVSGTPPAFADLTDVDLTGLKQGDTIVFSIGDKWRRRPIQTDLWHLRDVQIPTPDTPAGKLLGTVAEGVWSEVDPPTYALDELTDVDVSSASVGSMLQKQPGGTWQGVQFARPLNWLSDVSTGTIDEDGNPVAPDLTPPGYVLGTSGEGFWEPLSLAYIEEQIVTPLQQEIGDPHAVSVHTDLVGYIGEVADRVSALEATEVEVAAELHLFVDKYDPNYICVRGDTYPVGTHDIDLALATTAGPNGQVYADLAAIPGGAAVYASLETTPGNYTLGRFKTADGANVYGSTLKEWIRRESVLTTHKDSTDPAHPNLVVDKVQQPTTAGSSLDILTKTQFKALVAGATDWAAFKTAVAAL